MKRLTPEEREQQWQDYFNKTGCYAEEPTQPVHTFLRVDTQPMLHNTQDQHVTRLKPIDFKQLEREVTRKAIALIAAFIVALYLLSKLFS